ncbi:MAG: capsid protein [Alphaproteobacteria bacterium]|nr:capsid protein [Alphaproteobacteria bacterium]OJV45231.1 MAG: hypothetical protein BGO28_00300 [Alphaproteobacteria bacterium 43-37]
MTFTPSRPGINSLNPQTGDRELFLKVYSGEVLAAFEESTVAMSRHMVRTIQNGKSAAFPALWKADAYYHKPGEVIAPQAFNHGERVITIDDLLVSASFLPSIDEAMSSYDVRAAYSKEAGFALARRFDQNVLKTGILGARSGPAVSGGPHGSILEKDKIDSDSMVLAESIFEAAQLLDEKDVPSQDRFIFLSPKHYYMLARNTTVLNKDWGGSGAYSDGKVLKIAGITIVETNNLPNSNINDGLDKYRGDFSSTVALVMHKTGVGTVKLMEMATESEYDITRQGFWTVAKMAVGSGVLRPEACVELRKKSNAPVQAK